MTLPIAQVAVDQATIHFDKLYSYRVPAELQDHVWPGSMVLVPFGRGDHARMAVVLAVRVREPELVKKMEAESRTLAPEAPEETAPAAPCRAGAVCCAWLSVGIIFHRSWPRPQ